MRMLTDSEAWELICEQGGEVDGVEWVWESEEAGHCGRWTQYMATYFQVGRCFYRLEWERALTEQQENICYSQVPVEVTPKPVTVVRWEEV
jgi:hypothetical protein